MAVSVGGPAAGGDRRGTVPPMTTGGPSIETIAIDTSDGVRLAADVVRPAAAPRAVAVIAHPHPLYGGDRFNTVVQALARGLAGAGVASVCFDFRGAGGSAGEHDEGRAERLDVRAAVDAALALAPGVPLLVCGYSFGAMTVLGTAVPEAAAIVVVAPPLGAMSLPEGPAGVGAAGAPTCPVLVLAPQHDQFSPPDAVRAAVTDCPAVEVVVLTGTDHFCNGSMGAIAEQAASMAQRVIG